MKHLKNTIYEMRTYLTLWFGQAFSGLGSAMTAYALVIWSYQQKGSALTTALLMVCTYTPYVLFSIFAGALSDRWNKKATMLVCDSVAALSTVVVFILLRTGRLEVWHIYVVNIIGGLMNTVQQPASEVATTKVLPKEYYQKVGGLRSLSGSIISIFTPVITTAVLGMFGMEAVICFDLSTFVFAFVTLALFIKIPEGEAEQKEQESFVSAVKSGIGWLKENRGILHLILFLAAINFVASLYDAAFPAMMLSREGGSEQVMGIVNTMIGLATLTGSIIASFVRAPKSRIKTIYLCLLFSMSTENLMLALGKNVWVWSFAGICGWLLIPLMQTNLDAILRLDIPQHMQGRIYSVRNSLQFFTIPVGYFIGGFFVDYVCEPVMALQSDNLLTLLFGAGKGSGAALFFFIISFLGVGVCLYFKRDRALWELEKGRRD